MNSRFSFVAVTVLLGLALWWTLSRSSRTSTPMPTPPSGSVVAARVRPASAPTAAASTPDSVLDASGEMEPAIDGSATALEDPARVTPLPRTAKLAVWENLPPAPLRDPGGGVSDRATDGDDDAVAELPPVTLLENYRSAFRQYAAKFGGNPVGDNAEITAALNGGNPRQCVFLTSGDGLRVNGEGQAVDSWGTPYFFHQLSRLEMEIRSAGPDRRMWTADDLVLR